MPIVLIIDSPEGIQRAKLTTHPLLLGRSSSCNIKLNDGQVSGKHLSVALGKDGKTIVKDLETTNGTFLNGSKIMECHLFLEDEITIGDITIWIDPSEMSTKEKNLHTRAGEKTQHTFVNLPVDTGKLVKKAMDRAKQSQIEPRPNVDQTKFNDEEARQKEIMELLKKEEKEKISISKDEVPKVPEDKSEGIRTRVIKKAIEKNKGSKDDEIPEVRDGKNFELEASSGETQLLKISKPKKTKKK